jgi:hypothetical protein
VKVQYKISSFASKYHRLEWFGKVVKTGNEEVKNSGRYAAGNITILYMEI